MSLTSALHGPVVLVLGPHLGAISGVSAHVKMLLQSRLGEEFVLEHFQVGSEGRREHRLARWMRLIASPLSLALVIRRSRPALVHLNTSLNARAFWRDLAYMLTARLCGLRVLYQVHGGELPQRFLGQSRLAWVLLRAALAPANAIVVLAEVERLAYRDFCPGRRVLLIANAVDHLRYVVQRTACANPQTTLRLVYLGRLAREKGLHELLQGLALALQQGAAAHLTLVGSGPEEAALRNRVRDLGLLKHVSFNGPAFDAAKVKLLANSDVLALPSYSEGLPLALLEGMAAGNAVLASRVGAIPDVVTPGVHGLLVPPGNAQAIATALLALADDPVGVRRMQQACVARIAANHSIAHLTARFAEVYRELTATHATRPAGALTASLPEQPARIRQTAKCAE